MAQNKVVVAVTVLFVLFLIIASVVSILKGGALIVPGLAPKYYKWNEKLDLYVNKITSIHSPIPYRYNDLPVCSPIGDQLKHVSENLGEVITGDRIENSLYKVELGVEAKCQKLCSAKVSKEDVIKLKELVKQEYIVHWQLDLLPAAYKSSPTAETYESGFPLGGSFQNDKNQLSLNNHVTIIIHYSIAKTKEETAEKQYNIILFEVQPSSYGNDQCSGSYLILNEDTTSEIHYTYEVKMVLVTTSWTDRWKQYVPPQGEGQVHWFSIINSVMIVFFLSGLVAMIMARTIRRDFMKYMEEDDKDEVEESGWKLLRADVFRAPRFKILFSVLVGSGVQVFAMCVVTMVFAVLGFLSPSNSGSVMTAVLVLYVWMGVAAGYCSSRVYLMFEGEERTKNTLLTALLFPGVIFGIAFFLNFFLWAKHSSGAFPFTTMLVIMSLWFCISVPLCFLGSRLAYRKEPPKHPGSINYIPRFIPPQKWYLHPILTMLMGGILPFGAVFIELFFIMSSIWLHRYYFLFGFLFLVFLILVITCAEISVVMCYFQLCSEDWHWWWRSFLTSATSALYMFLYSIYYFRNRLVVEGFVPSLLYFGYSLILTLFFFMLTGTIGFYSCYYFVKKIYQAIHQD